MDEASGNLVLDPPLGISHTTITQYDALNNATTITDARGGITLRVFDAAG